LSAIHANASVWVGEQEDVVAHVQQLARRAPPADTDDKLERLWLAPEATGEPPARRGALVPRPRLVGRLTEGAAKVALLAAPAGYGKTTLLREWLLCDERPFAWVTLEERHDDAPTLLAAVEDALDDALPAGPRGPYVLVLDDVHVLRREETWEAVRTLARQMPPESRLALASRSEPGLPMGRMRANRELVELRAADLVMTTSEAAALLARCGLHVEPPEAEELCRRAEGWPAGLYLASMALRGQSDMEAAVGRFGGDDAIVSEYLRDEVLARLAPAAAAFLRRSSVLDRLSGPLCDAVLERRGSAQLLSSLGRSDLLLVPLDRKDECYRCHRLLAEMLRAELRRTEPEAWAHLHARASDWYAQHEQADRAVHHAVAALDADRVDDLLAVSAPEHVSRSRNATMRRWLGSFTDEQVAAHPGMTLAAANSDLLEGELDSVYQWELAARKAGHEAAVAILQAALGRDGVSRMAEDAARAYELEPEDSPWRPICCLLEGVGRHLAGDREGAEPILEEGVRRGAVAAPNIQTLCLAQLALGACERDDWETAAAFIARAVAQVEHYALRDYPTSALVFAVSAAVRARRGRVDEAQAHAREATRLLALLTDFMPWYEVEARVALAHAALRLSDTAGARDLLADAARRARRTPDALVLHEWIATSEQRLGTASAGGGVLTTAELRILGFLPTHLSFREIAGRLFVSANTVKTQAHAVYRKLDAASRSEAVTRATQLGLLDF
jgi:LuxR family transcriptional regulator, maltose regulon positive regulatory protein